MKSWNDVGRSAHFDIDIMKYVSRPDQAATRSEMFPLRNITPKKRLQRRNRPTGRTAAPPGAAARTDATVQPEMGEAAHRSGPLFCVTGLVAEQQTQSDVQHGALRTRVGCPA